MCMAGQRDSASMWERSLLLYEAKKVLGFLPVLTDDLVIYSFLHTNIHVNEFTKFTKPKQIFISSYYIVHNFGS